MRDAEDSFWSCASRHTDVGGVFCDAEPTVDECKWVRQYEVAYITLTRAIALCDELAELRARVAGQP